MAMADRTALSSDTASLSRDAQDWHFNEVWESLDAWLDDPHRYAWTPPPRPASEYEAVVKAVLGLQDAGKLDRTISGVIIQILLGAMLQDHVRRAFGESVVPSPHWFVDTPAGNAAS